MARLRIFRLMVLAGALFAANGERALAQSQTPVLREALPETKAAPVRRPLRAGKADRAARLDMLYEALAKAPNQAIAKIVEAKIEALNIQSGSATADLLMVRARSMIEAKDSKLAFELLGSVIDIAPSFIEARAQRATLYYVTKNIPGALADLRVVLAREPQALRCAHRPRRDPAGDRRGQAGARGFPARACGRSLSRFGSRHGEKARSPRSRVATFNSGEGGLALNRSRSTRRRRKRPAPYWSRPACREGRRRRESPAGLRARSLRGTRYCRRAQPSHRCRGRPR